MRSQRRQPGVGHGQRGVDRVPGLAGKVSDSSAVQPFRRARRADNGR